MLVVRFPVMSGQSQWVIFRQLSRKEVIIAREGQLVLLKKERKKDSGKAENILSKMKTWNLQNGSIFQTVSDHFSPKLICIGWNTLLILPNLSEEARSQSIE